MVTCNINYFSWRLISQGFSTVIGKCFRSGEYFMV